ncbi:MAG: glycosyltransferase family 1 protein [Candidatus Aenigmatarchaeota archaeon]
MCIVINGKFSTQIFSGVQRFALELTKFLIQCEQVQIVAPPTSWFSRYRKGNIKILGFTSGPFWEQVELPLYLKLRREQVLLLNLGNTAPIVHKMNIVTSHGLAWKFYPNSYSKKFVLWYSFLIPRLLNSALLIITVSNTAKRELKDVFGVDEEKIEVLYPGVSSIFRPTFSEPQNYILFVGTMHPIKNLASLIKALKIVHEEFKDIELWIVGDIDRRIFKFYTFDIHKPTSLMKKVKLLGFKKDEELVDLYNNALCLVLPSLYETFAFPVLEALACGCPVIVSDLEVMHELYENSVLYIDPLDPIDIASKIVQLLKNSEIRLKLRDEGLKKVRKFTWTKTFEGLRIILKDRFNLSL